MNKNNCILIKFSMILFLIFATAGFATADTQQTISESQEKSSELDYPIVLSGDLNVDGKKVPVGTSIAAYLGGKSVGSTVVTSEGKFGDTFDNKLIVNCEPEDLASLEFYVNNEKVNMDPLVAEIDSDGFPKDSITIDAEKIPVDSNLVSEVSGGMGGGGFFEEESEEEAANGNSGQEEGIISDIDPDKSIESEETKTSSGAYAKQIPKSEDASFNKWLVSAGVIGLLLIVGAVLLARSKKN